jgi:hypothetical protein
MVPIKGRETSVKKGKLLTVGAIRSAQYIIATTTPVIIAHAQLSIGFIF